MTAKDMNNDVFDLIKEYIERMNKAELNLKYIKNAYDNYKLALCKCPKPLERKKIEKAFQCAMDMYLEDV